MRRIEVTYSTMGQANPAGVEERKNYRWNGDPARSEEARKAAPRARPDSAPGSTTRKLKRLEDFAAALAALGEPDPWKVTSPAVIEAGKKVGVGEKTAKSYRTALRKQQRGESGDA